MVEACQPLEALYGHSFSVTINSPNSSFVRTLSFQACQHSDYLMAAISFQYNARKLGREEHKEEEKSDRVPLVCEIPEPGDMVAVPAIFDWMERRSTSGLLLAGTYGPQLLSVAFHLQLSEKIMADITRVVAHQLNEPSVWETKGRWTHVPQECLIGVAVDFVEHLTERKQQMVLARWFSEILTTDNFDPCQVIVSTLRHPSTRDVQWEFEFFSELLPHTQKLVGDLIYGSARRRLNDRFF